ncbi:MAG: DUF4156 domain-containing protein [Pseudomonadota bacterium]|nr:MAG: DUF4156 domain-containing protein [Pseudomonadota bacterium]
MFRKMQQLVFSIATVALLAGCAYVDTTEEGRKVRVVTAAETKDCKHLGKVRVNVAKMARGEKFVREDLIHLAQNNAAKNGADTIAPADEPKDGEQSFDMYKCVKP